MEAIQPQRALQIITQSPEDILSFKIVTRLFTPESLCCQPTMTVTYNYEISSSKSIKILRLIFLHWRGTVWQGIYKELLIWLALYATVSLTYRLALDDDQRGTFEKLALYCRKQNSSIPITFLLGFYVSLIMKRWWEIFTSLGWHDNFSLRMITLLNGMDERGRAIRQTIARQLVLMFALDFRDISLPVRKRFPTSQHLVDAGLMTEEERTAYESVDNSLTWTKFWVPVIWITKHLKNARAENYIVSDINLGNLLDELARYRTCLGNVFDMDWVNIPLVYTQVAHLSVRFYFAVCLISKQFLDPSKGNVGDEVDLYLPVFTTVQYIFFMGWIKVAEVGINPWGEDDDDFEINWLIDRHLQVVNVYLDQLEFGPETTDKVNQKINEIPYTEGSLGVMAGTHQTVTGSVSNVPISRKVSTFVPNMTAEEIEAKRKASRPLTTVVTSIKKRLARRSTVQCPTIDEEAERNRSIPKIIVTGTETEKTRRKGVSFSKSTDVAEASETENDH